MLYYYTSSDIICRCSNASVLFQKGQRDSGNPQFCYWIAYDSFLPHTIISIINQFSVISTKISILYTHISFDGKNPNLGCLSSSTVPFVAYLHVAVATSLFCLPFFVCFDRSLNALKGRIHDLRWHPSVWSMSKDENSMENSMESEEVDKKIG